MRRIFVRAFRIYWSDHHTRAAFLAKQEKDVKYEKSK